MFPLKIKIKIIAIIGLTLITIPEQQKIDQTIKSIAFTHTEYIDVRMPRLENPLIYAVASPKL